MLWQCEKSLSEIFFDSGVKLSPPKIFKSRCDYGPYQPSLNHKIIITEITRQFEQYLCIPTSLELKNFSLWNFL